MSDIIRLLVVFVILVIRVPFFLLGEIGRFFQGIDHILESRIKKILK